MKMVIWFIAVIFLSGCQIQQPIVESSETPILDKAIIFTGQSNARLYTADALSEVFGYPCLNAKHSGEPIEKWLEIEPFYAYADKPLFTGYAVDVFVWFQGEANMDNYNEYESKLKTLLEYYDIGDDCKIVICRVYCDYLDMTNFREYQSEMCARNGWFLIETADLSHEDGIHVDESEAAILADRIFQAVNND